MDWEERMAQKAAARRWCDEFIQAVEEQRAAIHRETQMRAEAPPCPTECSKCWVLLPMWYTTGMYWQHTEDPLPEWPADGDERFDSVAHLSYEELNEIYCPAVDFLYCRCSCHSKPYYVGPPIAIAAC